MAEQTGILACSGHLLRRDLDTDSDEGRNPTPEQIFQCAACQAEEWTGAPAELWPCLETPPLTHSSTTRGW